MAETTTQCQCQRNHKSEMSKKSEIRNVIHSWDCHQYSGTIRFSIIIHIGNWTDAAAVLSRIKVGVLNFHQEVGHQYYRLKG